VIWLWLWLSLGCGGGEVSPDLIEQLRADPAPCDLRGLRSSPEQAQREAVLLHAVRRLGWPRTDPVVAAHLIEAQRRVWGSGRSDAQLLQEALTLGMDGAEPAVRAHLTARLRRALRPTEDPGDGVLTAWLTAHAAHYRVPERRRVRALFADRARHADPVAEARSWAARSAAGEAVVGDGWWAGPLEGLWTAEQTANRLGAAAQASAWSLEPGAWSAPIATSAGVLVVRIESVEPGFLPPLKPVREAVLMAWRDAQAVAYEERLVVLLRERCGLLPR
jgi:hypothetical protein